MPNAFSRTQRLLGRAGMERLYRAHVAVFGIGGVGGYTVEALARSGIGELDLIDDDRVCLSNINRQIIATRETLGQFKVDVAERRIRAINPEAIVHVHKVFYTPQTADQFDFTQYDYVVDAIDTVAGKIALVEQAQRAGVPVISSMGAGNKLDPTAFEVADLSETSVCPLARVMRTQLRKRGIEHLKVVYSKEPAMTPLDEPDEGEEAPCGEDGARAQRRQTPGSIAFVPSVVGLIIAGEVVKDLAGTGNRA